MLTTELRDSNPDLHAGYAVEALTKDVVVGETYMGTVTRLMNFGVFVAVLPGKEGLVHISQLAPGRVEKVEDVVKVGDEIMVKVMEIDSQGRVNLSRKAVLGGASAEDEEMTPRPPRGNGEFRPNGGPGGPGGPPGGERSGGGGRRRRE
ncbi:MAG: hypothetical protein NVS2B8_21750 [Vulcanimicrobiaceae bacterium]